MNQSNSTNSKKNSDNQTEILEKNISTMSRVKKNNKTSIKFYNFRRTKIVQ